MERKNFDEFTTAVAAQIKGYLPEEYQEAKVELNKVVKNNDTVLTGLVVKKEEENICPTFYLENYYQFYKDDDAEMEDILKKLAEAIVGSGVPFDKEEVLSLVLDYERAKELIVPRLVNRKMNVKHLEGMPHTPVDGDLAVSYHVNLKYMKDGSASVGISNQVFEEYGVTLEELHKKAMENLKTLTPVSLMPISTVVYLMCGYSEEEALAKADFENEQMFVLSNEQKQFGAVWILDMEEMARIKEQIGDFYVIPSSVHEMILVRRSSIEENQDPVAVLNPMVAEVNATQLPPEEVLANHIYEIDWEKGELVSLESEVECGCALDDVDGSGVAETVVKPA